MGNLGFGLRLCDWDSGDFCLWTFTLRLLNLGFVYMDYRQVVGILTYLDLDLRTWTYTLGLELGPKESDSYLDIVY